MTDDIYLDKIKLGAMIVEKELSAINQFNQLISEINQEIVPLEALKVWPLYNWCFQNLSELYDFLKYDYAKKLGKKDQETLKIIFSKYQDRSNNLTLQDLKNGKELILKLMSKSRFHDVIRKGGGAKGLAKIDNKYKFNEDDKTSTD